MRFRIDFASSLCETQEAKGGCINHIYIYIFHKVATVIHSDHRNSNFKKDNV